MRRVTFKEEVELYDLDGSVPYEQLHECSNTSGDADPVKAESTFIFVNQAEVISKPVPKKENFFQVWKATTLPERKEATRDALDNFKYAFAEDSDDYMSQFEKTTSLLSKCFQAEVSVVQSKEVHYVVTTVVDTGFGPNRDQTRRNTDVPHAVNYANKNVLSFS